MTLDTSALAEARTTGFYARRLERRRPAPTLFTNLHGEERRFKEAAVALVMSGVYPSGRQIMKALGRDGRLRGKCVLNGKECRWKDDVFALFRIKPHFGYLRRTMREPWEEEWRGADFLLERGPGGALVTTDSAKKASRGMIDW